MSNYIPSWLIALCTESDLEIIQHREAMFLQVDSDGVRLPDHQQYIESPAGAMLIDSQKKAIIGYGPPSEPRLCRPGQ